MGGQDVKPRAEPTCPAVVDAPHEFCPPHRPCAYCHGRHEDRRLYRCATCQQTLCAEQVARKKVGTSLELRHNAGAGHLGLGCGPVKGIHA